jgi:predicted hydrocarbon binding protein
MAEAGKGSGALINLAFMGMGKFGRAFYQQYGDEALPAIAEVMGQVGVDWGKINQKMLPVKSMKPISEQFVAMGATVVELSDDTLHFRISHCPFGLEGTSRKLCESMMTIDEKRLTTFMGQEVGVKVIKSLAAGDAECDIVFVSKNQG